MSNHSQEPASVRLSIPLPVCPSVHPLIHPMSSSLTLASTDNGRAQRVSVWSLQLSLMKGRNC